MTHIPSYGPLRNHVVPMEGIFMMSVHQPGEGGSLASEVEANVKERLKGRRKDLRMERLFALPPTSSDVGQRRAPLRVVATLHERADVTPRL